MMLEIWRALTAELEDSPYLVCVGRVGWKSESFIADLPPVVMGRLRANGPSVVIGDAPGIAELNRTLGAPVYQRPEAPVPDSWKKQAAPVSTLDMVPEAKLTK